MRLRRRLTATAWLLAALIACGGCSTFTVIDTSVSEDVAAQLNAGRRVRVLDSAGARRTLKVDEVARDHLLAHDAAGADVRVDFADVKRLERRDFAPGKTAGLIAGLVLLVYSLAYAKALGELLSGL
jgi:hypothetical protein